MTTQRAFLMVWDGLRPDLVSPELTPNLHHLREQGVWFERSRAVYPTLTRANSPAISTGCRPGRHGVPGNTFLLRNPDGRLESHSSGDVTSLLRLAEADARPVLLVDTLADRVHRAGGNTVVVGSGSPGSAWLQHPRAIECNDVVIVEGLPMMQGFMQSLRARFGPFPTRHAVPATRWTTYFTRIITDFVLPELQPTLLVFWHTDPDHSAHARGYFAPETRQSLRDADRNLGAILRAYDELHLRETTAIAVTSDHGGSTITRRAQPARDLAGTLSDGAAAENGGSVFVYSSDSDLVANTRRHDYVGPLFTREGCDETFEYSIIGLDGPRAPDAVFSFTWSDEAINGIKGTATGAQSKLVMDHGSISPFDIHNTLVFQGADFRTGRHDSAPAGNIDICPTLSHVLGLPIGEAVDGRVLSEALAGASGEPEWDTWEKAQDFSARGRDWRQRVWFDRVESTSYLAGGTVEPRA
ncbi:MAG: alkaline phosphatase family protein [Chloroflexi bacterium]|nr:alkaline phosphatase family protein [Chloroflexota bacterium]